jgi:hypothetical protein
MDDMMARYPKLKVTHWIDGQADRGIFQFEQARNFFLSYDVLVVVEGTIVKSYAQLMELAAGAEYRDKEFLEVRIETIIGGG